MLCVHKIKDQNPTNIKLDANHINDMNNKKNNINNYNDNNNSGLEECHLQEAILRIFLIF